MEAELESSIKFRIWIKPENATREYSHQIMDSASFDVSLEWIKIIVNIYNQLVSLSSLEKNIFKQSVTSLKASSPVSKYCAFHTWTALTVLCKLIDKENRSRSRRDLMAIFYYKVKHKLAFICSVSVWPLVEHIKFARYSQPKLISSIIKQLKIKIWLDTQIRNSSANKSVKKREISLSRTSWSNSWKLTCGCFCLRC